MNEAARLFRTQGRSRFVFICDHASNYVPPELTGLGLSSIDLERHIAWDIGAAGVTEMLSEIFDAPAILSGASRLVVDCNRHLEANDLIPEISDGTVVPGNAALTAEERRHRIATWFTPYHDAVEAVLLTREQPVLVSVHSMTPSLTSKPGMRPQIALSSYLDRTLADPVLAFLRQRADISVGDNEPYDLDPSFDYSTPFHALRRGLPHLQVEFRQDEVASPAGQQAWAERFAAALRDLKLPCVVSSGS